MDKTAPKCKTNLSRDAKPAADLGGEAVQAKKGRAGFKIKKVREPT